MDHDQPPRREPHSHRSRVDRRLQRQPFHPHLGDDVAELAPPARLRDLLVTNAVTSAPIQTPPTAPTNPHRPQLGRSCTLPDTALADEAETALQVAIRQ